MPQIRFQPQGPTDYWTEPSNFTPGLVLWRDTDKETQGMLSADRIQYYVDACGMIDPFDPKNLQPASYDLTLGAICQVEGETRLLTPDNPVLEIPPNSIAFVSMRERLVLPHYIAARFNLRIFFIYQGLLLGTGPQVDPGFRGVLSCPLHNITNSAIRIQLGEPFATIDFEKTSGFSGEAERICDATNSEELLYTKKMELLGVGGFRHRLYAGKRWPQPVLGYHPGKNTVSSSVAALSKGVRHFRRMIKWGAVAGAVVAVLGILLPLGYYMHEIVDIGQVAVGDMGQVKDSVRQLQSAQREAPTWEQYRELKARLDRVEKSLRGKESEPVGREGMSEKQPQESGGK